MANKGTKNFFGNAKSWFGEKLGKKEDSGERESRMISESRNREKEMSAILGKIDVNHPQRKLSDKKVQQLNIPGVIAYALEELAYPLIIDQDIANLDKDLEYIIKALDEAIMEGRENTAEWACVALVTALEDLRTDIAGVDQEYAKEIMECRVAYIHNLRLLVELYRDYDEKSKNLKVYTERRKAKREELDKAKNHYQTRLDAGELDQALNDLETKIHDPAGMSDAARDLRDELFRIHMLNSSLKEVELSVDVAQVEVNNRSAQIDSRRNALATPPYVADPKINKRIEVANEYYRNSLRRTLNEVEQGMKEYNIHIKAMEQISGHSVFTMTAQQGLEIVKAMELERFKHAEAEREVAEKRLQAARELENIQEQARAMEEETRRINEMQKNLNHVPETEQESIVNVEYDLE